MDAPAPVPAHARRAARRAVDAAAVASVAFVAFALGSTQLPLVRAHSPWASDPYDGVVSFTMQLVPAVAMLTWLRCARVRRRFASVTTIRRILRGVDLVVAAALLTVVVDWSALALGAERGSWSSVTAWLVAWLIVVTGATLVALERDLAAWHLLGRRDDPAAWREPDITAEVLTLVDRVADSLERRGVPGASRLRAIRAGADRQLERPWSPRRHPVLAAAVLALAAGIVLALAHGLTEGVPAGLGPAIGLVGLVAAIEAAAVFVLALVAGRYLRLFPRTPTTGIGSRDGSATNA
jgi:hypothetical protein